MHMNDRCIHGLESLAETLSGCVLTVGNFDGVHIGHQRILRTARSLGDRDGVQVVAMTFDPPPDLVLRPSDPPERIVPLFEKTRLLLGGGCDLVVVVHADRDLLAMPAEDFVEQILIGRFAPTCIVEGPNFFFGRDRSGSIETLRGLADTGRFSLHVVDPVMLELEDESVRVSSTLIRRLILAGKIADAQRCLGREFALFGKIVPGTGRGSKLLGFPTVNLESAQQVTPADGVYAGTAEVAGASYPAAISIGTNPTLGGTDRTVEAYLIDCEGDFKGQDLVLRFVVRIREQLRLDSIETLKRQINKDVQRVREILK